MLYAAVRAARCVAAASALPHAAPEAAAAAEGLSVVLPALDVGRAIGHAFSIAYAPHFADAVLAQFYARDAPRLRLELLCIVLVLLVARVTGGGA